MTPPIVLDTDILSEILKEVDPNVVARATAFLREHGRLAFTSITVMEILYGLHRRGASARVLSTTWFLSKHVEVVPEGRDYRLAGEIRGVLDRRGTPIGVADPLIAACALNRNLPLATGNARHFGYVQAAGFPLQIEAWRQG